MMTTTPLECFVCREVFENFFYPGQPFNQQRHVIVTSVIVFSAMLSAQLAFAIPSMSDILHRQSLS